jgi:hypothetical protein
LILTYGFPFFAVFIVIYNIYNNAATLLTM